MVVLAVVTSSPTTVYDLDFAIVCTRIAWNMRQWRQRQRKRNQRKPRRNIDGNWSQSWRGYATCKPMFLTFVSQQIEFSIQVIHCPLFCRTLIRINCLMYIHTVVKRRPLKMSSNSSRGILSWGCWKVWGGWWNWASSWEGSDFFDLLIRVLEYRMLFSEVNDKTTKFSSRQRTLP